MARERTASFVVTDFADGCFVDETKQPLDTTSYSHAKYGDSSAAWEYGVAIADTVCKTHPEAVTHENLVVTTPGSVYAPKPVLAIAQSALAHLNLVRATEGVTPGKLLRIYEREMGNPSYANSSQTDRETELAKLNGGHHIPTSLVEGSYLVAVDDCVITGTTEDRQHAILTEHNPENILFAYGIMVDPKLAKRFPQIEHALNTSGTVTLEMVLSLIQSKNFILNSRVLNFILSAEPEAFSEFINKIPIQVRRELFEATMNSTLEFIERHSANVALLTSEVL